MPIKADQRFKWKVNYEYVDETADIAQCYSLDSDDDTAPIKSEKHRDSVLSSEQRIISGSSPLGNETRARSSDHFLTPNPPDRGAAGGSPYGLQLSPANQSVSSASPHFSQRSYRSNGSREYNHSISDEFPNLNEQEACLMRYFVVQLAPWVCAPRVILAFLELMHHSLIYATERDTLLARYH